MFTPFFILYSPEGEGYGGDTDADAENAPSEQNEEQEDRLNNPQDSDYTDDDGVSQGYDDTVEEAADEPVSDTPEVTEGRTGDRIDTREGEKYLKSFTYEQSGAKNKNQYSRRLNIPGKLAPPPGLPQHIHLNAGPDMSEPGLNSSPVKISVNKYVTQADPNTGAKIIDPAYDYVVELRDSTQPQSGSAIPPYYATSGSQSISFQGNSAVTVGVTLDMWGAESVELDIDEGTDHSGVEEELFIRYLNNNGNSLPENSFKRKITVVWNSGESKEFELLLPGKKYLDMGTNVSHTNYTEDVRADGCAGDGTGSAQKFTSKSERYLTYTGNQHNDYKFVGFFRAVQGGNFGVNFINGTHIPTSSWNNFRYWDLGYDSNGFPYNFGISGNGVENGNPDITWIEGIVANYDGGGTSGANTTTYFQSNNYTSSSMALAQIKSDIFQPPYANPIPAVEGYNEQFRFSYITTYSKRNPSCSVTPPPTIFDACLDQLSTDYYGYTGTDCDGNNLLAYGTPPVNYVVNPGLAQWTSGACCGDCSGLTLTLDTSTGSPTNQTTSIQGGSDGCLQVTVLDANGVPTGNNNATSNNGNGRYAWAIQALNGTDIGGLGSGTFVTVGTGYATHPQGINQPIHTFTFGHNVNLAQDGSSNAQSAAFAGNTALTSTLNGVTITHVPATTHNGTFSTGLVAGCYRVFVRDENRDPAGTLVPCYTFADFCIQDGTGIAGCTDNNANTNFGVALNYQANAVIDNGSCQYCRSTDGALIDSSATPIPNNGEIAQASPSSIATTPTQTTTSNDGVINITNIAPTTQFQQYINDVVDANGITNAEYTLQLYKAASKLDWDNAQSSATLNDLTNFSTSGGLVNAGGIGWSNQFTGLEYGYYAVKLAINDPDATVEVEECFQVFYMLVQINVCVDSSNQFATALTNNASPPGTLIITATNSDLWYNNQTICNIINSFCCGVPTLTQSNAACNVNELTVNFNCNPIPSSLTWDLELDVNGVWTTVNTNTITPTAQAYQHVWTQGSSSSNTTFVDDGNYRVVLTSSYPSSNNCTTVSNIVNIVSNIFGCTDSLALNYNPAATCDDGSCVYCIYGCTDPLAFNYNPAATCDDGSCVNVVYGCTDPLAINYNPLANTDDGSCLYGAYGCTDSAAHNYNKNCSGQLVVATVDDGCCFYPCDPTNQGPASTIVTTDATGTCGASNADGTVAITSLLANTGAMSGQTKTLEIFDNSGNSVYVDPTVYSNANSPTHQFTSTFSSLVSGTYSVVITDNFGCQETLYFSISSTIVTCGCTDPVASNYDPNATLDDGSCLYGGCIDPNADNFNPNASFDDGSCTYPPVVSPCIPSNTNALINLLQACIAKNGFQYYNKLVTGQADDCSIMNAWKVILIEYLVSRRGSKCIYNCADSATPASTLIQSCDDVWTTGGPHTGDVHRAQQLGQSTAVIPGTTITSGGGTFIANPSVFFSSTSTTVLSVGDVIKMPSGFIYIVVPPASPFITTPNTNPETASGATSGLWKQCVPGMRISNFPDGINYLDKFNTFVSKFCVDCNIEDDSVIKNQSSQLPNKKKKKQRPGLDGIDNITL